MISTSNPENRNKAVSVSGLVRSFGSTVAVDHIDLEIPEGMIYGLLGPNGAGKTTIVRILATLLRPDKGQAEIFGYDVVRQPDEVRDQISLTGQFASMDEDLTGFENLVMISRLWGYDRRGAKRRAGELLAGFDLQDAAGRQVKGYSGGMRRRLDIAASIVVRPRLIFLDEPTAGLDPRSRNQVWTIIRDLAAHGTTVLLTTQYLDEADQLADRIGVVDRGKIIAEGTSEELKARIGVGRVHLRLADTSVRQRVPELLHSLLGLQADLESDPASLSIAVAGFDEASEILGLLKREGMTPSSFSFGRPSLDEVFLALTDHTAGGESE